MKKALFIIGILLLSIGLVHAVSQEELNEARSLIDSKAACNQLSNEQLEIIGEYYMEQMMPGDAHKRAHEMMGLAEGSEAEEQFHINMARSSYCGGNIGMIGGNMMGSGMMGNYPAYYNSGYNNLWNPLWIIFLIGAILFVIWISYKLTRKINEPEAPINILRKRFAKGEITK
ncbi:TPA: hypothetical protein HA296_01380, partial [Candidatus Woesearchaeota archaeon]|nr:hypothetical protein [Candidatus Woesearchaeota archaeon]